VLLSVRQPHEIYVPEDRDKAAPWPRLGPAIDTGAGQA
jgi:hypothetical protein